jgi:YegS/Rv2252/BmrU family lipid kinase
LSKTFVIFNPTARGEKAQRFQKWIASSTANQEARFAPTTGPGTARTLAATAVRDGYETIVAVGGDGTVHEVLNGIADGDGFARVRLGIIPCGTINVIARELNLPRQPEKAWQVLSRARECSIDLPAADFSTNKGTTETRYFGQLGGVGLDARAVKLVSWPLKKRVGSLAYVLAGFQALAGKHPELQISLTNRQVLHGRFVLVGNGRFYGGSWPVFPRAQLTDGLLDLAIFKRVNLLSISRMAVGMIRNAWQGSASIQLVQAAEAQVTSNETVPLELDGELVGQTPVRFRISSQKVRVLAG